MTDSIVPCDLEIYAKTNDSAVLLEWLSSNFGELRANTAVRSSARNQHFLAGSVKSPISINVLEQPIRGYCALNIAGVDLPWNSDKMLAEAVFANTGMIIRCSDGHWTEGADPDAWLEVGPTGTHAISWNA